MMGFVRCSMLGIYDISLSDISYIPIGMYDMYTDDFIKLVKDLEMLDYVRSNHSELSNELDIIQVLLELRR
jgi:hypothetical protein